MGVIRSMRRQAPVQNNVINNASNQRISGGNLRATRRIPDASSFQNFDRKIYPKYTSGAKIVDKSIIESNKCSFNGGWIVKKNGRFESVVDDLNDCELLNIFRYSNDPLGYSTIAVKSVSIEGRLQEFKGIVIENHEDPRIFVYKDELYFSASQIFDVNGIKVTKIKLYKLNDSYKPVEEYFINVGNNNMSSLDWEKNWIFFQKDDELCFVYSLNPFIIFNSNKELKMWQEWRWIDHVHLRGGSNPVFIENNFYMFAHIKTHDYKYRMIIMQFNDKLLLIKRSNILDTLGNFDIVFPMGLIFVVNEQKFYLISGVDDREQYIVSFTKQEVDGLLIDI